MKIAVISKTRLPIAAPFRGGLEAFTHMLCSEYIRLGHDVTLYAHADSDPLLHLKAFYGQEHRDSDQFELYENDEYLSILRDIETQGFDIVHNNSTHELPIIWGATANIPVVTTLHTPPIAKLKAAISLYSTSKNLHFIKISHSFGASWEPYLNHGSHLIYNGADLSQWPLVRSERKHLLWYGRIVPAKGLDIALDAAHKVQLPLHFAGSKDDEQYYTEQIESRMSSSDKYLGHLSQSQILSEMKESAVVISAVRWEEPFGLTNIEAMSAGVPIAGFDRGAFRELVSNKSGVVAAERTVDALAHAVEQAIHLNSNDARAQAKKFSLERMVHEYISYFEGLL